MPAYGLVATTLNSGDVSEPAAIVTVAGTVNCVGSALVAVRVAVTVGAALNVI